MAPQQNPQNQRSKARRTNSAVRDGQIKDWAAKGRKANRSSMSRWNCSRSKFRKTYACKISQEPALYRNLQENAAAQNHGADFVRACAVETHVKISPEPLYTEIYRKNATAQNHGAACAVETHMSRFHKTTLYGNLQEKCRGPEWAPTPNVRTPQCGHTVWGNSHYNIL